LGAYERLKKLRTERKITQEEMALKLGYKNKSYFLQEKIPHFCKDFSPGTGGEFFC